MYSIRPDIANIAQIIARSRDVDPIIRRSVYLKALSPRNIPDPRVLSIMQRELVVKNGLGDREPSVRRATGYMLGDWHTHAQGDIIEVQLVKDPSLLPIPLIFPGFIHSF